MINKITFKNYKLFREEQTLELRPITVLIGKNNSGKSAVTKLPTMIAGSLNTYSYQTTDNESLAQVLRGAYSAPLNWSNIVGLDSRNKVALGNSFVDLVYNRNTIGLLEITLTDTDTNTYLSFTANQDQILDYCLNGEDIDVSTTRFKGILKDGERIEGLSLCLDYIGAFRALPQPSYLLDKGHYPKIGVDGRNAYPILINEFNNEADGLLLSKVKAWYIANFENWGINILKQNKTTITYEFVISCKPHIDAITLDNVGQGIHQALPLVVRSYMPDSEPTLIIIEEPETHLHPAVHANLAERFVDSFLEDPNKSYLIETHSQNFVLRLRRLVAEGKMKPKDLAIYYVDFDNEKGQSTLELLEVDRAGGVKKWPDNVFGEASIEARAIYNAQLNSIRNVDRN